MVDVGDHTLYVCSIENAYGDESKNAIFAWEGYAHLAPIKEN